MNMYYKIQMSNMAITDKLELGTIINGKFVKKYSYLNYNKLATIKLYNINITLTIYNWLLLAKSNITFRPRYVKHLEHLNFEEVKHNHFKTFHRNGVATWFKEPVEILVNGEICYIIPVEPHYAITRSGKIINIETCEVKNITIKDGKYPKVKLLGREFPVHRVVAMTFVINVKGFNHGVIVNHIDGNKTNYSISNLEWVTSKENSLHAVKEGLNKQAVKFIVYKTTTKSTFLVDSLKQLCKVINHNVYDIAQLPKLHKQGPLHGKYIVKVATDIRNWNEILDSDCRLVVRVYNNRKLVDTCYGTEQLKKYLNGYVTENQRLSVLVDVAEKRNPELLFISNVKKQVNDNLNGYEAMNPFTMDKKEHLTLRGLGKLLNVSGGSIINAGKKGESYLPAFEYIVRPKSNKEFKLPTEFARGLDVYKVYKDEKFIKEFRSLREMSKEYGFNRTKIIFVNNECNYSGYNIKFKCIEDRLKECPLFK